MTLAAVQSNVIGVIGAVGALLHAAILATALGFTTLAWKHRRSLDARASPVPFAVPVAAVILAGVHAAAELVRIATQGATPGVALQSALVWILVFAAGTRISARSPLAPAPPARIRSPRVEGSSTPLSPGAAPRVGGDARAAADPDAGHELNNLLAAIAWNCEALGHERHGDPRIEGIRRASTRAIVLTRSAREALAEPPPTAPPPDRVRPASDPLIGATLLLVDDEPAIRRLLRAALERAGCTVREAATGKQAIELAADLDSPLEAVVTDVRVRDVPGPELAAQLRRNRPDLPVLYMSGSGSPGETTSTEPHSRFLAKPFQVQQALERLRELLAPRRGPGAEPRHETPVD